MRACGYVYVILLSYPLKVAIEHVDMPMPMQACGYVYASM